MKKVITFSLWGDNPTYNIGAIKNAELAKTFYPEFECWFYIHKESVPIETIIELQKINNTKIILKNGDLNNCKPSMWRFEAIDEDNVEIMLSRDTDTRFLLREKLAVDEWLKSDKIFHVMRDHPHHTFTILAGMFGTKKIHQIPKWNYYMNNFLQTNDKFYDQNFLNDYIYPAIKYNSIIHSSFHKIENDLCKNFPIQYDEDYRFVGEYIYADDSRSNIHIEILKKSLG